jgi:hypothetical protein
MISKDLSFYFQLVMDSCEIDFDKFLEISRFDYNQWMQWPEARDGDGGSAALHALMSSYDIFSQHRISSLEDAGSMETFSCEQRWPGSGYCQIDSATMEDSTYFCHGFDNVHRLDNCNAVDAERPAFEFPIETYMYTEEELARLNDGRMAETDLYENLFDNDDDVAENCTAEGITGMG